MDLDKPFYQVFTKAPGMLFEILGIITGCQYTMKSLTFKELEQRSDGVMEPVENTEPYYLVEFQAYSDPLIYERTIIEIASWIKTYRITNIYGVIIFTRKNLDPKTTHWLSLTRGKNKTIHVFYLDKILKALEKKDPNHPIVLVFKPYLEDNKKKLEKNAKKWYNQLETNPHLPKDVKDVFCQVFYTWFSARFKEKTMEEVYKMLATITPFEETRVYQQLLERELKSKTEGKTEGKIEGEITAYKKLYKEGLLTKDIFLRKTKPLQKELEKLQVKKA